MKSNFQDTVYGPVSAEFGSSSLGDLCEPKCGVQTGPFGSQLHQKDYVTTGTPIITVEHLGENRILHTDLPCVTDGDRKRLSKYSLKTGDIVFSRVGSVDRRALVRGEEDGWLFSGRCLRIRPNPEVMDSAFLAYFFGLPSFKEYIRAIAVGATMPSLNTKLLRDVPVYFPSLFEQRAIASIFGALDDKIDLNRRMNETLEAMARVIFKDWFVDFGPVRAKAEGREPYLAREIWELFPNALDDEDKPVGWIESSLGNYCDIKSGKRPPNKQNAPNHNYNVPVYGGNGIGWYTTEALFEPPFLITGRVGTLGTVFRIYEKAWISDNALCCFPYERKYLEFIYFFLNTIDYESLNSGSTQPLLTQTSLKKQLVGCGNEKLVDAFHNIVKPLFTRIEHNCSENRALVRLRDLLLPKLMSGEIRLREAEKAVEAVA